MANITIFIEHVFLRSINAASALALSVTTVPAESDGDATGSPDERT